MFDTENYKQSPEQSMMIITNEIKMDSFDGHVHPFQFHLYEKGSF
jgi:hypothetical protein